MIQLALLPMPDALPKVQPSFDALTVAPADAPSPRLLERVHVGIRVNRYGLRTEQAYLDGIKRFISCPGKRHPLTMGAAEVEAFLSHLAAGRQVVAPNQAKAALFLLNDADLRLMEALRLRAKDVDFVRREIVFRDSKDRVTPARLGLRHLRVAGAARRCRRQPP